MGAYQDGRIEFHNDRRLTLQNGAECRFFIRGEITTVNAAALTATLEVFESAVLRVLIRHWAFSSAGNRTGLMLIIALYVLRC